MDSHPGGLRLQDLRTRVPGRVKTPVRLARAVRARAALRRSAARARSLDAALDLAFAFRCGHVRITPYQVRSEVERLLGLVAAERPRVVLEVGTAKGGTLFLWTRAAADDALLVSVDLPGGPFGGGYDPSLRLLLRGFARERQRVVPIRGDSGDRDTAEAVRAALAGRPVDFLFLDGDHTAGGLRRDLDLYRPLVRPGGLVALHDVVPGPRGVVGDVPSVWAELRDAAPPGTALELVESWEQGGAGIGVLRA